MRSRDDEPALGLAPTLVIQVAEMIRSTPDRGITVLLVEQTAQQAERLHHGGPDTYDKHPWYARLLGGERRGLGAELRLFGADPDAVEARARRAGARIVQPAATKGHGWREVMLEDPDGYVWAMGVPATKEKT